MLGKSFAAPAPSSRMVSVESEEDARRDRALSRFSHKPEPPGGHSPKVPAGSGGEHGTYSALSGGGVSTDDLDGVGRENKENADEGAEDFEELYDFQDSIYDLTVQYFCLAVGGYLNFTAGYVNLVCVIFLQCLNLFLQCQMLTQVWQLIMTPAMDRAAKLYIAFSDSVYGDDLDALVAGNSTDFDFAQAKLYFAESELKSTVCQCTVVSPLFFSIIMMIWTMFLGHELKQTALFALHLAMLPADSGHIRVCEFDGSIVVTGMSRTVKLCILLVVFIPKLMIAITLWFMGAQWLTATSGFENLVLNALALTFICDLDELIFRACVSEDTKAGLTKIKLPLPAFSNEPTYSGPIETCLTVFSCFGLTYCYVFCFQDVFPDYRWDLAYFCDIND